MYNENTIRALNLITCNARELTPRGNAIVNREISACLSAGLVSYAPARRSGYALTARGRAVLAALEFADLASK